MIIADCTGWMIFSWVLMIFNGILFLYCYKLLRGFDHFFKETKKVFEDVKDEADKLKDKYD